MALFVGASESYDVDAWEAYNLKKENKKLRELVYGLYHELDAATQYDAGGSRGVINEFADRMRELGIKAK